MFIRDLQSPLAAARYHHIPYRKGINSLSNAMEQRFDDYAIAEFAKQLGDSNTYKQSNKRSYWLLHSR